MARNTRGTSLLFTIALLIVILAASLGQRTGAQASHHPGGMDAMSIDMNTAGNTATSLDVRQSCGEVNPGGTLTFDITAEGIPPYNNNGTPGNPSDDTDGLSGYTFRLIYDEAALTMESQSQAFLIASNPGSTLFNSSQVLPDTNGDNRWTSSVLDVADTSSSPPESGSGVLSRVTISVAPAAPGGFYNLDLTDNAHLDPTGTALLPDDTFDALLAVNVLCQNAPAITPTPVPTIQPTPAITPPPNPTPTPGAGVGGMDRMSFDTQIAGNTATSLGPRHACVAAVPGDRVTIDLVAVGVPAYSQNGTAGNFADDYGGMIAFSAVISYDESALTVESQNQHFMLEANPGSALADSSQTLPDTNNDGFWRSTASDLGPHSTTPEGGSGVITRLTVLVDATASPGMYVLTFVGDTFHLDASGAAYEPKAFDGGYVAVSTPCDIDADGIADNLDACQSIPGPSSNNGCPPAGPPAVGGIAGLQEGRGEARTTPQSEPDSASGRFLVALGAIIAVAGLTARYGISRGSRGRLG